MELLQVRSWSLPVHRHLSMDPIEAHSVVDTPTGLHEEGEDRLLSGQTVLSPTAPLVLNLHLLLAPPSRHPCADVAEEDSQMPSTTRTSTLAAMPASPRAVVVSMVEEGTGLARISLTPTRELWKTIQTSGLEAMVMSLPPQTWTLPVEIVVEVAVAVGATLAGVAEVAVVELVEDKAAILLNPLRNK